MIDDKMLGAIEAHIESLSDRDNDRYAETCATQIAIAQMAVLLHRCGAFPADVFAKTLRVAGVPQSPAQAKLAVLADGIDSMLKEIPGKS